MRLLEIRANPLAYFMPTMVTPNGHFFSAAPPGIAPELAELFMIPVIDHRRSRANDVADPNPRSPKKARIAVTEEPAVEIGRRAESEAAFGIGSDVVGGVDHAGDFDGPSFAPQDVHMESYDPRLPSVTGEIDNTADFDMDAPALPVEDLGLDTYDSQSCSIGIFDLRSKKDSDSQTQTQTQEAEDIERSTEHVQSKGYSQNTIKAIGVIRRGLEKEKADDKYLSFVKVSEKVF
jgi:cohesin complex subunit SCC1